MQVKDNRPNTPLQVPQPTPSMPSIPFATRPIAHPLSATHARDRQHPAVRSPLSACALATAMLMGTWCSSAMAQTPASTTLVPPLVVPSTWSAVAPAPPSATPAATPDTRTAADLAPWWTRFNDPLLSRLITQSLQANTSIRSAQAALLQARALRDAKAGDMRPGVTASASAQTSQTDASPSTNAFRAGLDASWELDLFGAKRNALNATEADAVASEASLADVQVSVAAELALAYLALRGQQARLQIAQNNLANQQETLQLTDWRAQAGLVTSLEVEQARTAVEQTSAQIPTLQTSIRQSIYSLSVLTGQAPAAPQSELTGAQPIPAAPGDWALSIPAETLRQRADVRAAEARITGALARVSATEAARYPSFSLGGSLGLNALTLAGLTNGASLLSSLLARVSVPLLDGGTAKAQVRAQEAGLEQARMAYQSTVLTALKDVENALVALQGDRQRLVRLQNAATAADNAALLAQQRYASGLIDFQVVLQTQRTQMGAQDSVASALTDTSADHVRLYKALGGGWQ